MSGYNLFVKKYLLGIVLTFVFNTLNYHLAYDVEWFTAYFYKTYANDFLMGIVAWTIAIFWLQRLNRTRLNEKSYLIRYVVTYLGVAVPAVLVLVTWTEFTSWYVNEHTVQADFYTYTLPVIALESAFFNLIILNYDLQGINSQKTISSIKIELESRGKKHLVSQEDVDFFYTENQLTRAQNRMGQKFTCTKNLSEMESILSPNQFFRANRQYIINRRAVASFAKAEDKKLIVSLSNDESSIGITVSRTKAPQFKKWIAG